MSVPLTLSAAGWIQPARHFASTHCAPRPPATSPVLIVIHGISLPPGEFGGDAVNQLFCGELDCDAHPYYERLRGVRVSAHFYIRRAGELLQFVSTAAAAWHAGDSEWRGKKNCNDFSIGIELEGCDDIAYEATQYTRLAQLITALAQHYAGIQVTGHCHIAPARKSDPGAAFDWQKLFNTIGDDFDGRST